MSVRNSPNPDLFTWKQKSSVPGRSIFPQPLPSGVRASGNWLTYMNNYDNYQTSQVFAYVAAPVNLTRREGGGPWVKKLFSIIFTYVVALLILFPKWAHLPHNSARLLRYDPSKLGHFRPFSSICIGKSAKFAYKFLHFFENLSHQMFQMTPNLVSTFRDIKSRDACKGFLIF